MAEGKVPGGQRPGKGKGPSGPLRPVAARPGSRPSGGSRPAGAAGARPAASRPAASHPAASRSAAAKPAASRPAASRSAAAKPAAADPRGERLQKVMAHAGVASRRHSEELIQAGRVTVGGRVVTELGTRVKPGERVEVDGKPLAGPEQLIYIVLNKPRNYMTTLYDPQGRPTVLDLVTGVAERVYPVGRLDFDTEGLLLLTNDGTLSHALAHPARLVKKTYLARVRGVPTAAEMQRLRDGVELEDGPTAPAEAKLISSGEGLAVVALTIHEGRNRQVRRMFDAIGHEVIGLRRIRVGNLGTQGLAPGQWRELTVEEVQDLYHHAGLKYTGEKPAARGGRFRAAARPAGAKPVVAVARRFGSKPAVQGTAVKGPGPSVGRPAAPGTAPRGPGRPVGGPAAPGAAPRGPGRPVGRPAAPGAAPRGPGPSVGRPAAPGAAPRGPAPGRTAAPGAAPRGGKPGAHRLPEGPLGDEIRTALERLAGADRGDGPAPRPAARKPGARPAAPRRKPGPPKR